MCEIYGFSGERKRELNNDLRQFYSHSSEHPNGWGLALFNKYNTEIIKEVCRADKSELLTEKLQRPLKAETALAHIRLATIGNEEYDNCHPFLSVDISGRMWTLIHNGTIFESDNIGKFVFQQKGETDSERILLYIVDSINKETARLGRELTAEERFWLLDTIIRNSSPKNKLNLLIYDGEILYAHTNFRDSLYYRKDESGATFSTRPLSEGKWENVPFTTLLGYKDGERLFTGTNHGNEYFFDPSSYTPLYMLWIFRAYNKKLSESDQIRAVENFKNSALYDIDGTALLTDNAEKESLRTAGMRVLGELKAFYGESEVIAYQIRKLAESGARYAEKVRDRFKDDYIQQLL